MENKEKIERSKLWNDIYSVIKQIPRKEVSGDAMDYHSASTKIERLFLMAIESKLQEAEKRVEEMEHIANANSKGWYECKEELIESEQRVKELEKFIKTVAQHHKLINRGSATYQSLVINLSKKADNLLTPKNQ